MSISDVVLWFIGRNTKDIPEPKGKRIKGSYLKVYTTGIPLVFSSEEVNAFEDFDKWFQYGSDDSYGFRNIVKEAGYTSTVIHRSQIVAYDLVTETAQEVIED